LGGEPAFTLVLHTWKQDLGRHVHVHALVAGGALTAAGEWVSPKPGFLFPEQALSAVYRGKFIAALDEERANARLREDAALTNTAWRQLKPTRGQQSPKSGMLCRIGGHRCHADMVSSRDSRSQRCLQFVSLLTARTSGRWWHLPVLRLGAPLARWREPCATSSEAHITTCGVPTGLFYQLHEPKVGTVLRERLCDDPPN